jgi:hypothetical protein
MTKKSHVASVHQQVLQRKKRKLKNRKKSLRPGLANVLGRKKTTKIRFAKERKIVCASANPYVAVHLETKTMKPA